MTAGLDTVLAKLKDGDMLKLEVAPNQPRASALEDWLQRVGLKVGGWHRLIGGFFDMLQEVGYEAYNQYLSLQPMDRSSIRPRLDWYVPFAHLKYMDIEGKLRPVLLEAVPTTVRQQALATRATSTVEVMFHTLIWAGPGTLKDKKDVLAAVERRDKGAVAVKECHATLQRWQFDLVRLQRLQMAPPDPVVQVGILRTMVSGVVEQFNDFHFRLMSYESKHGLSGASIATQGQVEAYWSYLSAETLELADAKPQKKYQQQESASMKACK